MNSLIYLVGVVTTEVKAFIKSGPGLYDLSGNERLAILGDEKRNPLTFGENKIISKTYHKKTAASYLKHN